MKTKLYFSYKDWKYNLNFWRFHITHSAIVSDLICNVWKFCKDQTYCLPIATDLGTLTSASINLVFNKELLIVYMWSAEQNISQAGKGVFHKIPGHARDKNTFFSFLFQ